MEETDMRYYRGIESYHGEKKTAVTLGKFDGLHRGHQKLVDKIREYASDDCESVVCAFDMGRDSLMTNKERRQHLEGKVDFCFGHGKRGDVRMLAEFSEQYGYTLDVIEKERYRGTVISSTYIKDALMQGDVELARTLLGYPYGMSGTVVHGNQLGRTLGFPTMNIEPEKRKIMPWYGVYACRVKIDGKWYGAIGNAGIKPTVTDEQRRLLEVFVYGYEGDAYGKEITALFCAFERPETKFGSVEELKEHVTKDKAYGEEYFRRWSDELSGETKEEIFPDGNL